MVDLGQRVPVEIAVGRADEFLGRSDHHVQHRMREIQQERRFRALPLEERQCFVGVELRQRAHVAGGLQFLPIAPKRHRAVVVSTQSAIEVLESLIVGQQAVQRLAPAHVPLSDRGGSVARVPEHLGHRDLVGPHRPTAANPPRISPGHQRTSRRAANGLGVEAGESGPLARHPIQARRAVSRGSIGDEVAVADIVKEDDHEIRARRFRRAAGRQQQGACE